MAETLFWLRCLAVVWWWWCLSAPWPRMPCLGWEVPHQAGSNMVCGGGSSSVGAPQQDECSQA